MAKLRPGRCYRKLERPYTRVSKRKPSKDYVKGAPPSRITQFEMGTKRKYDSVVYLISKDSCQVRHNALEAARISIVKHMEKHVKEFFIRIRPYPHHVLRENPLATGAGADRYQKGMRLAFGKPIGRAAQIDKGQIIAEVHVDEGFIKVAKEALKKAAYKLPMPCRIEIKGS